MTIAAVLAVFTHAQEGPDRTIGVMLPYTPLHHLLLAELGYPVVATSGNVRLSSPDQTPNPAGR